MKTSFKIYIRKEYGGRLSFESLAGIEKGHINGFVPLGITDISDRTSPQFMQFMINRHLLGEVILAELFDNHEYQIYNEANMLAKIDSKPDVKNQQLNSSTLTALEKTAKILSEAESVTTSLQDYLEKNEATIRRGVVVMVDRSDGTVKQCNFSYRLMNNICKFCKNHSVELTIAIAAFGAIIGT